MSDENERIEKLEKLLAAAAHVINAYGDNEGYVPFAAQEDHSFLEDVLGVDKAGSLRILPPGFSKEWHK